MNFDRLVDIARKIRPDNHYRLYHVTFILKKKKIVSVGINQSKTHPKSLQLGYKGHQWRQHSELRAWLAYGKDDCSNCVFVNVRIDNNGNLANSRFCLGCQHLLSMVGFKKAFFTNEKGQFEEFQQNRLTVRAD